MEYIDVGGRLHSKATGNILTGADEILYEPSGKEAKKLNLVNEELYDLIAELRRDISGIDPGGGTITPDLSDYALKTDLNDYALKTELPNLDNYVTISELNSLLENIDAPDLTEYAKKDEFKTINNISIIGKNENIITATPSDIQGLSNRINGLYTKEEVNDLVHSVPRLEYEIVNSLPENNIDVNKVYLIKNIDNSYSLYIYKNNDWVNLGESTIDLNGYVTNTNLQTTLNDYVTNSNLLSTLDSELENLQPKLVSGVNIKKINGLSILGEGEITISGGNVEGVTEQQLQNLRSEILNKFENYYNTNETYSQEEIDALISSIPKMGIKVVLNLPETNINNNIIYLVYDNASYTEYFYDSEGWHDLGSSNVFNLEGYALLEDIPDISGKQDVLISGENIKTVGGENILGEGNISFKTINNEPIIGTGNITISGGGPDLSGYATKTELNTLLNLVVNKNNIKTINNTSIIGTGNISAVQISDLLTLRRELLDKISEIPVNQYELKVVESYDENDYEDNVIYFVISQHDTYNLGTFPIILGGGIGTFPIELT